VLQGVGKQVVVWGGWVRFSPEDLRIFDDGAVFDLNSGEWRPTPASPLSARANTSFTAVDGRVFIRAGEGHKAGYLADGALFDPRDDSWTLLPKAPAPLADARAFTFEDLVLLTGGTWVGGRDVHIAVYSATSNSWAVPDLSAFRGPSALAVLGNGDAYAWSGFDPNTEHAILHSVPDSELPPSIDTVEPNLSTDAIRVDPGLVDYIAESSGAAHVQLQDAEDPEVAVAAMRLARSAVFSIPHPEEPDDPLPSFASAVTMAEGGPTFWFDIADAEVHDGTLRQVVKAMVTALDAAGATGWLSTPASS